MKGRSGDTYESTALSVDPVFTSRLELMALVVPGVKKSQVDPVGGPPTGFNRVLIGFNRVLIGFNRF